MAGAVEKLDSDSGLCCNHSHGPNLSPEPLEIPEAQRMAEFFTVLGRSDSVAFGFNFGGG